MSNYFEFGPVDQKKMFFLVFFLFLALVDILFSRAKSFAKLW